MAFLYEKIGSIWSVSKECMEDKKKKEAAETFLEFCYQEKKIIEKYYKLCI